MTHRTDEGPDYDVDSAALEIGRAFLSAQRAASSIIAKAQREAETLAAEMPTPSRQATAVDRRQAPDMDTEALAARVDDIERALFRSQEKLLRMADEPASRAPNGRQAHYRLAREAGLVTEDLESQDPPVEELRATVKHTVEGQGPADEPAVAEDATAAATATTVAKATTGAAGPAPAELSPGIGEVPVATWEPPDVATLVLDTPPPAEPSPAEPGPSARLSWPAPAASERLDLEPANQGPHAEYGGRKSGPILIPGGHTDRPWMANLIAAAVALVILGIALLLVNAL